MKLLYFTLSIFSFQFALTRIEAYIRVETKIEKLARQAVDCAMSGRVKR